MGHGTGSVLGDLQKGGCGAACESGDLEDGGVGCGKEGFSFGFCFCFCRSIKDSACCDGGCETVDPVTVEYADCAALDEEGILIFLVATAANIRCAGSFHFEFNCLC
jgi:hypothetical protein